MLCATAKMAVLGAFGTEKVIFPYRIVGLVHFYLFNGRFSPKFGSQALKR